MGMKKTGPDRSISGQARYFLLRNGRAGVLEDQGDEQAQEDARKARYHPEASSADELAGDEQPAHGQNRRQNGQRCRNDAKHIQPLGGKNQKKNKDKSVSQQNLCHQFFQRAIAISLCHD